MYKVGKRNFEIKNIQKVTFRKHTTTFVLISNIKLNFSCMEKFYRLSEHACSGDLCLHLMNTQCLG